MRYLYLMLPFLVSFYTFLSTLYGSIAPYRDSGDLIVSSYTFGIAHPPGYCLYIILGKIFIQLIPWGNIAYRVQVFSALFASLNIIIILVILRDIYEYCIKTSVVRAPAGALEKAVVLSGFVVAGFTVVFSSASWSLSQVAEMYPQQAFLSLIILWLLLKFYFAENNIFRLDLLLLSGMLFGLTLGMHQTVVLFVPGYVYLVAARLLKNREITFDAGAIRAAGVVALFFMLGFAVYAYLPIRSFQGPVADWGDPENFRNFWRLITRADYGILKLHPGESSFISSFGNLWEQIVFFCSNTLRQVNPFLLLLCIMGMFGSFRLRLGGFLMVLFIFSGPFFSMMANLPPGDRTSYPILETNLILPNLIMGLWVGMAFIFFARFHKAVSVSVLSLACVMLSLQIGSGYSSFNRRDNFIAYDYGRNIQKTLEKGACIYDPDDSTTFITEYLQRVEDQRTDIKKIVFFRTLWGARRLTRIYPDIMPPETFSNAHMFLAEFFRKNIGKTPIYSDLPGKVPGEFEYFPKGFMYRFIKKPFSKNSEVADFELSDNMWRFYSLRLGPARRDGAGFFNQQILSYYMSGLNNLGLKYAAVGRQDEALERYNRAVSITSGFYEVYNNIAIVHYNNEDYDNALKYFKLALERKQDEPSLNYNIGLSYRKKKDYTRAFEYLLKVKTAPARNEIGNIFLDSEKLNQAERYFKEAVGLDSGFLFAYYNLGVVYQKKNEYQLSEKYYKIYRDKVDDAGEKRLVDRRLSELRGRK